MASKNLATRKKTFAHKVRTGCDTCKKRRLKCDETKPTCIRCQRSVYQCHYNVPKPRIFDPSARDQHVQQAPYVPSLNIALSSSPCTQQEKFALSFFLEKTGPYMADFGGPLRAHSFWTTALPRAFHSVPATRHLITAIGLMETCIGVPDAMVVKVRCQEIHRNYSLALRDLMQPDLHPLDLALAPLMAWLLETLMLRDDQAEVHAKALEKITSSLALDSDHLKCTELSAHELECVVSCVRHTQYMREKNNVEAPLEQVLAIRSHLYKKETPLELLQAFKQYYETFDPPNMTLAQLRASGVFIHEQNVSVHGNVYRSEVPKVVFAALAYLCNLSLAVLPTSGIAAEQSPQTHDIGLDFHLEQFEDMLTRTLEKRSDQALLNDVVSLALQVMALHTPAAWRVRRSERLAQAVFLAGQRSAAAKANAVGPLQKQADVEFNILCL